MTNGTSSFGILGHATIANGNNNILDIPVAGQPTRQLALKDGCQKYKARKGWIKSISFKESKNRPAVRKLGG